MTNQAAIENTLPTEDDELMWELAYLGVPVHIQAGNRQLRAALGDDVDEQTLQNVIRWRKAEECEACHTGTGRHTEPRSARTDHFTPGVRSRG
ncbi:hypothetical protein ACFO9E_13395 [Streptomyces maoxianensis]|uniref:Uncharacterized protein n=1 Tax=Streptomyces maoxianensis TaxID=1459942 RepID=A0ABV9G3M6_9ACTN